MSAPRHHVVAGVAKAFGRNVPQVELREQAEHFTSSFVVLLLFFGGTPLPSTPVAVFLRRPPPPPLPRMAQQPATTPPPATTNQPQGSQRPVTNAGVGALQALVVASVQTAVTAALQDLSSSVDDRIVAALRQQRLDPPTTGGPPTATLPATMPPAGTPPSSSSGMVGGHSVTGVATHMPDPALISGLPLLSASGIQSIPFPPLIVASSTGAAAHVPPPAINRSPLAPLSVCVPMAGPCAIPIPPKLAQRIWNGEFIDMAALLPECISFHEEEAAKSDREGTKRVRRKVSNILQWVECFHLYINAICARQPDRISDLLGYASLIVHAARKFRGDGWTQYDKNFRKRAAASPGEQWGVINQSLLALAFSSAEVRPHCALCFSLEHSTEECVDYEEPKKASTMGRKPWPMSAQPTRGESSRPICVRWNKVGCTSSVCSFRHVCLECHQPHKSSVCQHAARYAPYPRESRRDYHPPSSPRDRPSRDSRGAFRGRGGASQ